MNRFRNLLLLTLLLVCAGSFWWARRDPTPPDAASGTGPAVAVPVPEGLAVAVLNGTDVPGLARRASRLLARHGCVVVAVADAPHDTFARSLLVNRRLPDEAARLLASRCADPPLITEWDARRDEDAVLVLGRDHQRVLDALAAGP